MFNKIKKLRNPKYNELSTTIYNAEEAEKKLIELGIYDKKMEDLLNKWKKDPRIGKRFSKEEMIVRLLIRTVQHKISSCSLEFSLYDSSLINVLPFVFDVVKLFPEVIAFESQIDQWNDLAEKKCTEQKDKNRLKEVKDSFDKYITKFKEEINLVYPKEDFFPKVFHLEKTIHVLNYRVPKCRDVSLVADCEKEIALADENIKFISNFIFERAEDKKSAEIYCKEKEKQLNSIKENFARSFSNLENESPLESGLPEKRSLNEGSKNDLFFSTPPFVKKTTKTSMLDAEVSSLKRKLKSLKKQTRV